MGSKHAGAGMATGSPCLQRRRSLLWPMTPLLSAWLPTASQAATGEPARAAVDSIAAAALAALEQRAGGRLGVALLDTGSGAMTGHRLGERFALCSTFKLLLAAEVWRQIDQGRLKADQWVPLTQADMVDHAPMTSTRLARGGMTVAELAQAAQATSDNPAANLLLGLLGGPAGFTAALREAGDTETRLDRLEPQLNAVGRHDPRDTTTPAAMARSTARMLTGDWLAPASRETLIGWMVATETGTRRLRAGLPAGWRAGDKTGTGLAPGLPDKINDVAIAWPPGRAPIVVTAYFETAVGHARSIRAQDEAVLAEVGRIAARWA